MENGFQTTFDKHLCTIKKNFVHPFLIRQIFNRGMKIRIDTPPPRAREFLDQGKMNFSMEVAKHAFEGFGGFFPYLEDPCNLFLCFT